MNPVELGCIELNEKVIVSDPCYDRDTWCMQSDLPVVPGRYKVTVHFSDEEEFGNRVASLVLVHEDCKDTHGKLWQSISTQIGVDSGQCGVFDDSIYPITKDHPDREPFYDECCNITLSKEQAGLLRSGKGVVSSSGYGDGSYELSAITENGKCVALMLDYHLLKMRRIMDILTKEKKRAGANG